MPKKRKFEVKRREKIIYKRKSIKKLFLSMVDLENQYKKDLYGLK